MWQNGFDILEHSLEAGRIVRYYLNKEDGRKPAP